MEGKKMLENKLVKMEWEKENKKGCVNRHFMVPVNNFFDFLLTTFLFWFFFSFFLVAFCHFFFSSL